MNTVMIWHHQNHAVRGVREQGIPWGKWRSGELFHVNKNLSQDHSWCHFELVNQMQRFGQWASSQITCWEWNHTIGDEKEKLLSQKEFQPSVEFSEQIWAIIFSWRCSSSTLQNYRSHFLASNNFTQTACHRRWTCHVTSSVTCKWPFELFINNNMIVISLYCMLVPHALKNMIPQWA